MKGPPFVGQSGNFPKAASFQILIDSVTEFVTSYQVTISHAPVTGPTKRKMVMTAISLFNSLSLFLSVSQFSSVLLYRHKRQRHKLNTIHQSRITHGKDKEADSITKSLRQSILIVGLLIGLLPDNQRAPVLLLLGYTTAYNQIHFISNVAAFVCPVFISRFKILPERHDDGDPGKGSGKDDERKDPKEASGDDGEDGREGNVEAFLDEDGDLDIPHRYGERKNLITD